MLNMEIGNQNLFGLSLGEPQALIKVSIFLPVKGTKLLSSTSGMVLYTGTISKGGKVIVVLGPKWKLHYYAHLESIDTTGFSLVKSGEIIGAVGDSGNAKGKPPHLHYSILSLLPHLWKATAETQGWKKMFFLDPVKNML